MTRRASARAEAIRQVRRWLDSCAETRCPIHSRLTGSDVPTRPSRRSWPLQHRGRLRARPGRSGRLPPCLRTSSSSSGSSPSGAAGFFRGLAAQMLSFVGIVAGVIAGKASLHTSSPEATTRPGCRSRASSAPRWEPLSSASGRVASRAAHTWPSPDAPRSSSPTGSEARWLEGWSRSRLHGQPPSSSSTNPHSGCDRKSNVRSFSPRSSRRCRRSPCSEPSSASIRCPSSTARAGPAAAARSVGSSELGRGAGRRQRAQGGGHVVRSRRAGSGWVLRPGLVATNAHVVAGRAIRASSCPAPRPGTRPRSTSTGRTTSRFFGPGVSATPLEQSGGGEHPRPAVTARLPAGRPAHGHGRDGGVPENRDRAERLRDARGSTADRPASWTRAAGESGGRSSMSAVASSRWCSGGAGRRRRLRGASLARPPRARPAAAPGVSRALRQVARSFGAVPCPFRTVRATFRADSFAIVC